MRILLSFVLAITCFSACQSHSSDQAEESSSALKLPDDSLAFYFPALSNDPSLDSFVQKWYSSTLFALREPILSKEYIGHDVYRFLWLRSFHRPVVFSLHNRKGGVWLQTKILERYSQVNDDGVNILSGEESAENLENGIVEDSINDGFTIWKSAQFQNIVYNKEAEITAKDWRIFGDKVEESGFWDLPVSEEQYGKDGSRWVIEAHTRGKYHVVDRWSPEGDFRDLGLYLMELSGVKEEIY